MSGVVYTLIYIAGIWPRERGIGRADLVEQIWHEDLSFGSKLQPKLAGEPF